uniref:Uncharacterized protein LOC109505315 n=1 Tax=Elaeis guineensis var. tenera TaxID=51953 RepID=A0A6J0PE26_ELAGV
MGIECEETLTDDPIEDFNPLELATSEKEYEGDCENLEGCANAMRYIIATPADFEIEGYSAEIMCDVLSMEIASVLLCQPWIYDVDAHNFGRENTYVFTHNGKKIKLKPAKPSMPQPAKGDKKFLQTPDQKNCHILTHKEFEKESGQFGVVLAVLLRSKIHLTSDSQANPPLEIEKLKEEFKDVTPEDILDGLPPMHDIQHVIDLVPGLQIPNLPHYRLNPKEREEMRKQVE